MARLNYVPRKKTLKPKKSPIDVIKERMHDFLDIVEREGPIKDIILQLKLGLGDGQYDRLKRAMKSLYPDLVEWHKKTKTWKSVQLDPEKLVSEQVTSKPLEEIQIE